MNCEHELHTRSLLSVVDDGSVSCSECGDRWVQASKLEATEKERLDLLARVGYAEGAGEEGLRRWELAEERCKALSSRLGHAIRLLRASDGAPGYRETVNDFLRECDPVVEKL